jgi:hypothetical protein
LEVGLKADNFGLYMNYCCGSQRRENLLEFWRIILGSLWLKNGCFDDDDDDDYVS